MSVMLLNGRINELSFFREKLAVNNNTGYLITPLSALFLRLSFNEKNVDSQWDG